MTKKRDTPLERAAMRWSDTREKMLRADLFDFDDDVCAAERREHFKAEDELERACAAHQKRKGK